MAVSDAERKAFADTRTGVLIGEGLAAEASTGRWATASRCSRPSSRTRPAARTGSFDVVGIIHSTDKKAAGFFDQLLLLHWAYFDDTTPYNRGSVGWYVTHVADVNQADRVAKAIDALSANSDHETRTQTEQAATASWMKQLADIGLIVTLHHGRRVLHADAAGRQHDDAGGARAHRRARRC